MHWGPITGVKVVNLTCSIVTFFANRKFPLKLSKGQFDVLVIVSF